MIARRPEESAEIKKLIDEVFTELEPISDSDEHCEYQVSHETDEWFTESNDKDTIKSNSPFTQEFLKIEFETTTDDSNHLTENCLFNLHFIKFLQNNFMPYIFIWAGFIFRNIDSKDKYGNTLTHITQGSIEKHFGTTKIANGHIGLYPAEYATSSANTVITGCKLVKSAISTSEQ